MSLEERMVKTENALATLVKLAQDYEERMDMHLSWINQLGEAQANSERKIAALADAQIRTEEALTRLSEAQLRTEENIARLATAQAHTDQRLDALIDIVRERLGGQSPG